jgi:hypothetical protein
MNATSVLAHETRTALSHVRAPQSLEVIVTLMYHRMLSMQPGLSVLASSRFLQTALPAVRGRQFSARARQ